MLDPETFMKNSPFQVSNNISYNLSNTTPELLKFQLQEQTRAQIQPPHTLNSPLAESAFNCHLQNILNENRVSFDEDTDGNDENLQISLRSEASTPSSEVSDSWKSVADLKDQHYSNLRVLIENSVFDTSKISPKSILSLNKLQSVKKTIAEKKELKEYLEEKCLLSNQFCSTLLATPQSPLSELDSLLLLKVLKQISDLQLRLMDVSQELDQLNAQLQTHNLVCLVSGYIEDVRISNLSRNDSFGATSERPRGGDEIQSLKAFEALFSHIASLAAQKNVPLPEYPSNSTADTLQDKIKWASDCINSLVSTSSVPSSAVTEEADHTGFEEDSLVKDHSFLSASPYTPYKKNANQEKVLSEYKLALDDLKFSQEYFAKEYEYLKENSLKTILEYRKKNTYLEKELNRVSNSTSSAAPQISSRDSLKSKDQEIFRLRRELNNLKIDSMGGQKSPNSTAAVSSSLLSSLESNKQDEEPSNSVASPTHLQSMSTAILRKEFKKIVEDIQDQYEIELEEERAKRRELELQMLHTTTSS